MAEEASIIIVNGSVRLVVHSTVFYTMVKTSFYRLLNLSTSIMKSTNSSKTWQTEERMMSWSGRVTECSQLARDGQQ